MSKYVCQYLPTTSVGLCIHALHGSYDRSWRNWGSDCANEIFAGIFCRTVVARSCLGSCVAVLTSKLFLSCLPLAYWIHKSLDGTHSLWIDVLQSSHFLERMRCSKPNSTENTDCRSRSISLNSSTCTLTPRLAAMIHMYTLQVCFAWSDRTVSTKSFLISGIWRQLEMWFPTA